MVMRRTFSEFVKKYSKNARQNRAKLFNAHFSISEDTKILDIGSEDGSHIDSVLNGTRADPKNVYIADINVNMLNEGTRRFGFNAVEIRESEPLPFPDNYFDIVFCSSVIEHVTIPKEETWACTSGSEFRSRSLNRQKEFAREVRRLASQYYVQTPYRYFPVESHTWLPLIGMFPRRLQIPVLKLTNSIWVKSTTPDWYLLNKSEMRMLFPDAEIVDERSLGLTKSIIAIKYNKIANR